MTFSFVRSDKPVYTTASIRPFSPCQLTQAMVGPTIPHIWNPYPAFPGRINHFYGCLYPGLGRPHEGFQDFGYLDPFRPQAPHQHFGAQRGNFGPPSLGFSLTGPPSFDLYRQHYCCSLYQQTERDPFPYLLRLVVDLLLWLQLMALAIDALSQDWQGRSMYIFPLFPLLSKVIQKLRTTQEGEVILIATWWPSQPWFPHLLCLCVDHSSFHTASTYCHNRDMYWTASHTICTHGGSHAALPSSRIFKRCL